MLLLLLLVVVALLPPPAGPDPHASTYVYDLAGIHTNMHTQLLAKMVKSLPDGCDSIRCFWPQHTTYKLVQAARGILADTTTKHT